MSGIVLDEFFIDQNDIGLVEENEEIENDLEDEAEDGDEDDPLNSSTDSTSTSLTAIMKPDGAMAYDHDSCKKGLSGMAKSRAPGPRRRRPQNPEPDNVTEKTQKPVFEFHMPDSPDSKSAEPKLDQSESLTETESSFHPPPTREKISAKNRATSIIQSQRRLQNSKKQVLSQAAATLIGSSDSSSDEEMELSYRSQRQRTSTQAPGGAPIPKIISGSSQSQVEIKNIESTAIVPDTQDQTVKPKSDQSGIVIPDTDEESSSEHQTRLSRMSQEGFQKILLSYFLIG